MADAQLTGPECDRQLKRQFEARQEMPSGRAGDAVAGVVKPSGARMLAWLCGSDVLLPDGGVLSWSSEGNYGFRYPEAAGWLLEFLCRQNGQTKAVRNRIARGLRHDISPAGGFGRAGRAYAFDTAVVLMALTAHETAGGEMPEASLPNRLFRFLCETLGRRKATDLPCAEHPQHWSHSYGCHLLRIIPILLDFARRSDACGTSFQAVSAPAEGLCHSAQALAEQLIEDLLPLFDGARFRIHADSPWTYTHAHCYAVEGMLGLLRREADAGPGLRVLLRDSVQWLADIQCPDGGIPAWHNGKRATGECRGDTTAQAIRLWAGIDCRRFRRPIGRAFQFLANLQRPCGGLVYSPSSRDLNTWVTTFAVDAAVIGSGS